MRESGVIAIGCLALATGAFAADWTAYNDSVTPFLGEGNVTQIGRFTGTVASGELIDWGSGTPTGVIATHVDGGSNGPGSGAGMPAPGTDAYNLFNDKVTLGSLIYYGNAEGWYQDVVFTGLDPSEEYTFASLHNRGSYTDRWSVVSILDADSSTYACSAGAFKVSETSVSLSSDQTTTGYAAQWTNIKPGADGDFTMHYTHSTAGAGIDRPAATNQDGRKAYPLAGFMLQSGAGGEPPPPPPPPPPTGSFEVRISGGSDDAEEHLTEGPGNMDVGSTDLELGSEGGGPDDQLIGLRFRNLQIPAGSTIESASIQFHADETDDEPTSLLIRGELNADPAAYVESIAGNISSRTPTVASVPWNDIPVWDVVNEEGPDQETPDISSIIQEIVDLGGWAPGNSLAIMIEPASVGGERTAESVEGEAAGAPLLKIVYTPEPATMSLLGLGALALIRRRRRA